MILQTENKNDVAVSDCRCGKNDPMVGMYFVACSDNGGYARGFIVERSHQDYWMLQFYRPDGTLGNLRLTAVSELDGAKFYLSEQAFRMACMRSSCV
jgi:hypothetical protein